MTREELRKCCHADILSCSTDNLVDLNRVEIAANLPLNIRMEHYLNQVQNPYLFRVDNLIVKVTFSGTRDLSSAITDLLIQS